MESGSGRLFIVSAPSGAGKTTLCNAIRRSFPSLTYSISYTTRRPRDGETDGIDYHFTSRHEFERGIQEKQWAEWADVYGNYYGTSAAFLDRATAAGQHILLDIDVQGAEQILKRYPESISIFIMPPSMESLRERLAHRGADDEATVARRLAEATIEMDKRAAYRHVLVNDDLGAAVEALDSLFAGYIGNASESSAGDGNDRSAN